MRAVVAVAVVELALLFVALLVVLTRLLILGLLRSNHCSLLPVLPIQYHRIGLRHSLKFQKVQIDPQEGEGSV